MSADHGLSRYLHRWYLSESQFRTGERDELRCEDRTHALVWAHGRGRGRPTGKPPRYLTSTNRHSHWGVVRGPDIVRQLGRVVGRVMHNDGGRIDGNTPLASREKCVVVCVWICLGGEG